MPDNPGVQTWGEYLAAKEAKAVTSDEGDVEDKAVKKAATKTRKAADTGD